MKLSEIAARNRRAEEGGWVDNLPFAAFAGVRLKVRALWNSDYRREFAALAADVPRDRLIEGKLGDEDRARISTECLKRTVLVGWDGIEDEFTPENVEKVFADPELAKLFGDAVVFAANVYTTQYQAGEEIDAKN